jgi:hypothetical protein
MLHFGCPEVYLLESVTSCVANRYLCILERNRCMSILANNNAERLSNFLSLLLDLGLVGPSDGLVYLKACYSQSI